MNQGAMAKRMEIICIGASYFGMDTLTLSHSKSSKEYSIIFKLAATFGLELMNNLDRYRHDYSLIF